MSVLPEFLRVGMRADVVFDVKDVAIDMSTGMEMTAVVFGSDCIFKVAYTVEVLAGAIIDGAPGVGTRVNASSLTALMAFWKFALPSLLEELFLCC